MSKSKQRSTVDSLLADRARFEAWLDQLAAKAGQVPPHVAARVKADYEVRLNQVLEELHSRADELLAEAATFEARVAELDGELTARRDARAEDELRALVGEYGEGEWEEKRAQHDSGIAAMETDREASAADLARVKELLAQATRPSQAMAVIDVADIPAEPTEVTPPEPAVPVAAAPAAAPSTSDAPLLDGLGAILAPPPAPEAEPPRAPEPPKPAPRRPTPFDEIAFLKTVVGRPDAAASPARTSIPSFEPPPLPDGPTAATTIPRATPARLEPAPKAEDPAAPQRLSGNAANAGEGARSLKCQECGWMNYPTEWYCEKCGGELAAF
jgi:hypothetical protein